MQIIKANGEKEVFKPEKLRASLKRANAKADTIERIVSHIEDDLVDGATTDEIYSHAFSLLKKEAETPVAARYSLRRAVAALGPSGFPFESFLAEIFVAKGFKTQTGAVLRGLCTEHEVDVVAENDDTAIIIEAKFHNNAGLKSALKTALYVHARAQDLQKTQLGGKAEGKTNADCMLITNTKFTRNAISYAKCAGLLSLVSWGYPKEGNLEDMIEQTALHPLTCLTTLSGGSKKALFDRGTVLCRAIKDDTEELKAIGLSDKDIAAVHNEAQQLCIPRG